MVSGWGARVYERRSDLSPDGSLFVAFVPVRVKRKQKGRSADSWIAVSRPPWFSALALLAHRRDVLHRRVFSQPIARSGFPSSPEYARRWACCLTLVVDRSGTTALRRRPRATTGRSERSSQPSCCEKAGPVVDGGTTGNLGAPPSKLPLLRCLCPHTPTAISPSMVARTSSSTP